MNNAAFGVSFILAIEVDHIALFQRIDKCSQTNIVRDQYGQAWWQLKDKLLMFTSFTVVGKQMNNNPHIFDLNITGFVVKSVA